MDERGAMSRAVALAMGGWGRVAPNPLVGAVLLEGGAVVGEGFHAEFGGPHAEAAALAACDRPAGTTCVVTLEPCAHRGKTPACTGALIEAGVARVVLAGRDPNPEAEGGAERLREAGIDVAVGTGAAEAAAMNAPYLWGTVRPDRPFVALKLATTVDGYVADEAGRSQWVSGEAAREHVQWLRAGFDAIGVGRRTAAADDPSLTARGSVTPRVAPRRVVFARDGALDADRKLVRTAHDVPTMVLAGPAAAEVMSDRLGPGGVEVRAVEGIPEALRLLRSDGVRSLLVEGGGRLAGVLLDAGLVDRLYWIQAPVLLGGGVPAFDMRRVTPLADAARWTVVERRALGVDTLLVVDRELCLLAS